MEALDLRSPARDVEGLAVEGAGCDAAIPLGGVGAVGGRQPDGRHRTRGDLGAIEDVVVAILIGEPQQLALFPARRDGAGKEGGRGAEVVVARVRRRDLPRGLDLEVLRVELDEAHRVGAVHRHRRSDHQVGAEGGRAQGAAHAQPEADPQPAARPDHRDQDGEQGEAEKDGATLGVGIPSQLRAEDGAGATVPGGDVHRAGRGVDRGRAPDAGALAAGRHRVEGRLQGAGRGIELDQLALHQGAVVEGRHTDIDAPAVDGGRAPDQMVGRCAERAAPEDVAAERIERDHLRGARDRIAGRVQVAAAADVEHRPRPAQDALRRDGAGGNDAGDGARRRGGDGVGDEAVLGASEILRPGGRAIRPQRVFVTVPGAHVDEAIGDDRLGRDRPIAQLPRPARR